LRRLPVVVKSEVATALLPENYELAKKADPTWLAKYTAPWNDTGDDEEWTYSYVEARK
jgi:hypothetical protein